MHDPKEAADELTRCVVSFPPSTRFSQDNN